MTTIHFGCADCTDKERELERLREALMAAHLHLMVRPHMRLSRAEENVKALIRAALDEVPRG